MIANIPYKKAIFNKINFKQVILLSLIFIVSSFCLFVYDDKKINIRFNYTILTIFIVTTILWFIFPKVIRFFGQYPISYINDKKNKARFIVRFEFLSMIVKYFEILFQQVIFIFLIFVILTGLPRIAVVFLFTSIVVFIHLGNLFFMSKKWAIYYTILSFPMAIIFGHLILEGYALITFSIHLLYYLISNSYYWLNPKYSKSK